MSSWARLARSSASSGNGFLRQGIAVASCPSGPLPTESGRVRDAGTVSRGSENSMAAEAWFAADASHSQEKARPILFGLVEGQTALSFVLRDPALGTQFVAPLGGRVKAKWPSESVVAFKDRASGPQGLPWLQRLCDPRRSRTTSRTNPSTVANDLFASDWARETRVTLGSKRPAALPARGNLA